jgi:hypothetical protein
MFLITPRLTGTFKIVIVAEAGKRTPYSMTTHTTNAEICSVCKEPVEGGFEAFTYSRLGVPRIEVEPIPGTNFIVCDWCNKTYCFRCTDHPDSGFCNDCYRIMSVSIDDDKENNGALQATTMEQEPKIIYEEPKGSEIPAKRQTKRILNLMSDRQVDIADFQGRIDSLSQKLEEIANDFQENMLNIDRAILDALHIADADDDNDTIEDDA